MSPKTTINLKHCFQRLGLFIAVSLAFLTTASIASTNNTTTNAPTPTLDSEQLNRLAQNNLQAAGPPLIIPPAPSINAKAYVLMDANSGKIIAQKNMDQRLPPASLTKMMTLYVASNAINNGQINLADKVLISKKAWAMGGSKMFVKYKARVPVNELIQGIIVDSGNDACIALAQYIAGDEATFAQIMNQTAKALGMNDSHFTDSTGLPHPDHYSTSRNLAILARALIKNFPDDYKWYKQKWFTHSGIKQSNRNLLLWRDPTVDGLKTGHTKAAGYCLVASAKRDGMRLISVVMGTPSTQARANSSQALLNYGFRFFTSKQLYHAAQPITHARVWFGKKKSIPLGPAHDVYTILPVNETGDVSITFKINHLTAPIAKNTVCGQADLMIGKEIIQRVMLVSLEDDQKTGTLGLLSDRISLWLHHVWRKLI